MSAHSSATESLSHWKGAGSPSASLVAPPGAFAPVAVQQVVVGEALQHGAVCGSAVCSRPMRKEPGGRSLDREERFSQEGGETGVGASWGQPCWHVAASSEPTGLGLGQLQSLALAPAARLVCHWAAAQTLASPCWRLLGSLHPASRISRVLTEVSPSPLGLCTSLASVSLQVMLQVTFRFLLAAWPAGRWRLSAGSAEVPLEQERPELQRESVGRNS